ARQLTTVLTPVRNFGRRSVAACASVIAGSYQLTLTEPAGVPFGGYVKFTYGSCGCEQPVASVTTTGGVPSGSGTVQPSYHGIGTQVFVEIVLPFGRCKLMVALRVTSIV